MGTHDHDDNDGWKKGRENLGEENRQRTDMRMENWNYEDIYFSSSQPFFLIGVFLGF